MTITARSIATPVGEMLALLDEDGALVALPFVDETPLDALAVREAGADASVRWDANGATMVATALAPI